MKALGDKKLGTFLGVFTPTILTILGVIMYLRSGWLVGHLGLTQVILIIILANVITLITTLSFSSVATNIRVGVGGAYYIISRSLGLEIGGAIGLPLFLAQVFSVTLYAFGFAESLRIAWDGIPVQATAFVIVLIVGILTFFGAKLALKTQIPLMVLVGISLIALAVGAIQKSGGSGVPSTVALNEISPWVGFAVFFPAVTGVMAGLGLSGDLKNPIRAIPVGSILAVCTGFAVYLIVPILLVMGASQADLRADPLIWLKIAPYGMLLILPGLWGAIFSSAVGSMLGAPRTLQALAMDRMAPRIFGRPGSDTKALMPGLILSMVIALSVVFLGDLNTVALYVTMFFLTTYGTINIVAALETLSGDPSWRPKLRVPWYVSLVGGLGCILVIFLINPIVGVIAIVAEIALWSILSRRERKARWGDARRGIYESLIRWALIRLAKRPMSPRNWRPHIMVFVSDPLHNLDLIRFGNWFSQGRGVVSVCELIVGDLLTNNLDLVNRREKMQQILDQERLVVFAELNVVQNVVEGITNVAQSNGMAGLQSNTILLGWPKKRETQTEFLRVMHRMEPLKKSFILGRIQPRHLFRRESVKPTIHVWWGGLQRNGDLMLLLAYLLTCNTEWRHGKIQVMSIASNELMKEQTERNLQTLISEIRIQAEPKVILKPEDKTVRDMIHSESEDVDVVIFGLAMPEIGEEEAYAARLEELAGDLPTVFFVKNSSMFIGELLKPSAEDEDQGEDEEEEPPEEAKKPS